MFVLAQPMAPCSRWWFNVLYFRGENRLRSDDTSHMYLAGTPKQQTNPPRWASSWPRWDLSLCWHSCVQLGWNRQLTSIPRTTQPSRDLLSYTQYKRAWLLHLKGIGGTRIGPSTWKRILVIQLGKVAPCHPRSYWSVKVTGFMFPPVAARLVKNLM